MICSLDKNKINSAITQKINEMADITSSLKKEGNVFIPVEGSDWKNDVKNINDAFKGQVLVPTAVGFKIDIPSSVIRRYIFTQKGSKEQVIDAIREEYLSQFSKEGLNLTQGDFWLNHPFLENPKVDQLIKFAQKINPNFKIGILENMDENGVALIRDYVILLRESKFIDDLPEEVSHFFVELLPEDNPLLKGMLKDITSYSIYGETYENYKNNPAYQIEGRPNIDKIKKEAVAKLISEYIKAAFNDTADAKYKNKRGKIREFVDKVMKFLRKAFYNLSGRLYPEPILSKNNFELGADMILEGNTSMLDLKKVPSPYDSVFYETMENNKAEAHEGSTMAKTLHTFAKSIKITLKRKFFKYIDDNHMEGLKEVLADPKYKNFNRVYDVMQLLSKAEQELDFMAEKENVDLSYLTDQVLKLGEAYHELEQIPIALDKVLDKLREEKKNGKLKESELVNKITEVQNYLQLSKTFSNITKQFESLLNYIHEKENQHKDEFPYLQGVYEELINNVSKTQTRFKQSDEQIFKILRDYLLDLSVYWTEDLFKKYTEEIKDQVEKAQYEENKLRLLSHLQEQFTTKDQLRAALTGDFPKLEEFVTKDGRKIKWNNSKIKDITGVDHMIFMIGATSTMSDPFVSNALAFYVDKVFSSQRKSREEQMSFANKIMPYLKKLSAKGMDYYAVQRRVQNVQKFFDPVAEDKTFERRALMSQTNRYEFQYEKQVLNDQKSELQKDRYGLQQELSAVKTDEEKEAIKAKITDLTRQIEAKTKEINDFIEKYSHRDYTDEFYQKRKVLDEMNEGDSTTLQELKKIQKELISKEDKLVEAFTNQIDTEDNGYMELENEIAALYDKKLDLKSKLPQKEQSVFDLYEELYEPNEEATALVVARHKRAYIQRYIKFQRNEKANAAPLDQLIKDAEQTYEWLYRIATPTQEFWDARNKLFEDIQALAGQNNDYTRVLSDRLKELEDKRKLLLSSIRNYRQEVSLVALEKNNVPNSTKRIYDELAEIENETEGLKTKIRILGSIQSRVKVVKGSSPETVAKNFASTVDVYNAFVQIFNQNLSTESIVKTLGRYFTVTPSIAKDIQELFKKAIENQDQNNFPEVLKLLNPIDEQGKFALNMLKDIKLIGIPEAEEKLLDNISNIVKVNKNTREKINEKFSDIADLGGKQVSIEYLRGPYLEIRKTIAEILNLPDDDPTTRTLDMKLIQSRAATMNNAIFSSSSEVEKFLGDGLLDEVINYLEIKAEQPHDESGAEDLAKFLKAIHTNKVVNKNVITSPRDYIKKLVPNDPSMVKLHYPNFLQRNKVKDQFVTKKVYETHPDVVAGKIQPNVDINGEWLPKPDKDSKFYNHEYDKLKNGTDEESQTLYQLLKEYTNFYLDRQEKTLVEGQRLDLVIPSRMNDKFENKVLHIRSMKEWKNNIREFFLNFKDNKNNTDAEAINYNEELGIATKQNREIYTGTIIAEASIKLNSRRRIPVQRVSEDVLSNMLFFINDTNEYSAKAMVAPIFKSFADVFKIANEQNPQGNKLRADVFKKLLDTKFYDNLPEGWANNPIVGKLLKIVNKFAVSKLLADPLGAMVNLIGGELQMFIDANLSKHEIAEWGKTGWKASSWAAIYVGDTFTKHRLSKETQISNALGFLPEETDIAHRMSDLSIVTDWRKALMFPRSITEVEMGIHLGLSVANTFSISRNGVNYKIEDIYELNKDTGILELIPEFKNDQELSDKWNLVDGTEVAKIRRNVVQKYTLIQGNFFKFNQDYISTTAIGRSVELMKRWFVSGYIRRFQPRTLDPFIQDERIGFHLPMLALLKELLLSVAHFRGANMDKFSDYWNNGRTYKEKIAFRQSLTEIALIFVAGMFITFVLGYDDDDKDRAKRVKEMNYWQQIMLLISMRAESELGTYIPLPVWGLGLNETKRALFDPISTIRGTVDNIVAAGALGVYEIQYALGNIIGANTDGLKAQLDFQKDVGGKTTGSLLWGLIDKKSLYFKDKGDSKALAFMLNTIGYTGYTLKPEPYIKTLTQMNNKLK
jgi:hypothetical protein